MTASTQDQPRRSPDWSVGRYEHVAAQLLPAARVLVEAAAPAAGERVLDIGCGTGSAALLAAERGARVTGVDPAARLVEVARQEASARGLDATFVQGEAGALPVEDGCFDLVLSSFGVIFAEENAAAAEMARVAAPNGRLAFTAWIPEGALSKTVRVAREAVNQALGTPPAPPLFPWHEQHVLADLLGPYGFDVTTEEHSIAFTASSAREYMDAEFANHPVWVAGREVLEPRGEADAMRQRALDVLEGDNEDPDGFRVTSHYVVALARRA